jgi:hypothetical protein
MIGPKNNDLKSISEFNWTWADRIAYLILAGLLVDVADLFIPEGWWKILAAIGANLLIFGGVWGELWFAKRARDADDNRVVEAQLETERLRAENLAVQRALIPRRINMFENDGNSAIRQGRFKRVESFAGTKVALQWVPDFESKILARDIALLLARAEWSTHIVDEAAPLIPPMLIGEGVNLFTQEAPIWERTESGGLKRVYPKMSTAHDAAVALKSFLKLDLGELSPFWGIGYSAEYPDMPSMMGSALKGKIPDGGVLVLVGMKPRWAELTGLKATREMNPKMGTNEDDMRESNI